ncbi:MAG: YkgJ family cysteine cluster protein [Deltaproteobacteria bacterium]|nr:YkgJ family cysteine cluster protein [Deltaproteobacteria bacterium]
MPRHNSTKVSVYKTPDQEWLTLDSRFTFRCHAGLACFNRCCRTATIMLSPYDLLRLARALEINTGELLKRYTRREMDAQSNLPLVFIDLSRSPGGGCPFAGTHGCQVYHSRPAACRLFPITMGSRLAQNGIEDFYFCRRLDYCQGFDADTVWTVASWRANQGFQAYDEARREWLNLILAQGLRGPLQVEAAVLDLMATIMYDLDAFRSLAGATAFRQTCGLADETAAILEQNDAALLDFSCRYLADMLFTPGKLSGIFEKLADRFVQCISGAQKKNCAGRPAVDLKTKN